MDDNIKVKVKKRANITSKLKYEEHNKLSWLLGKLYRNKMVQIF